MLKGLQMKLTESSSESRWSTSSSKVFVTAEKNTSKTLYYLILWKIILLCESQAYLEKKIQSNADTLVID